MKVNNNDGLWNKGGDADVHQLVQVQLQIASAVEKKSHLLKPKTCNLNIRWAVRAIQFRFVEP